MTDMNDTAVPTSADPAAPASDILLSVVATSRNDNHGGGLTQRMQHFVDGFITQCKRHNLRAELIMVEWNPPADRPPLRDALVWPDDFGPCQVRIVTFSRELHATLPHAQHLPLYQMIAKNVGIVRARGKFVLATNIDILFSDEIIVYMRDHLEAGHLYRNERHDIPSELPALGDFGALLDWCRKHTFRINANGLSFPVGDNFTPPSRLSILSAAAVRMVKNIVKMFVWEIGAIFRVAGANLTVVFADLKRALGFTKEVALPPEVAASVKLLPQSRWAFYRNLVVQPAKYFLKLPLRFWHLLRWMWSRLQVYREFGRLFTNACGDFTLLSREDWFKLRGYPEWPIYSFHIDSILLYQSDRAGIVEVHLPRDHSVYHIEHDAGSGFTPEYAHKLFERLEARGIPYLDWEKDVSKLIARMNDMRRRHAPVTFNGLDWGYQSVELPEETLTGRVSALECA
jgi:hypothetical protein